MSKAGKVLGVAVLAALGWAVAGAQPPIQIGASLGRPRARHRRDSGSRRPKRR